jgi:hypothetical protein
MNSSSLAQTFSVLQHIPMMVSKKVNGMTTVNDVNNFAYDCVVGYATYDDLDEFYSLDVTDLPDFVRHEFAAMIMASDDNYANEACGADNKMWDDKMLPALIKYLKDSTNKDAEIEFSNVWREATSKYLEGHMQGFIEEALTEYNDSDHFDE